MRRLQPATPWKLLAGTGYCQSYVHMNFSASFTSSNFPKGLFTLDYGVFKRIRELLVLSLFWRTLQAAFHGYQTLMQRMWNTCTGGSITLNVALIILACIQRYLEFRHTHSSDGTAQDSRILHDHVHLLSTERLFQPDTSAKHQDNDLPVMPSIDSTASADRKISAGNQYKSIIAGNGIIDRGAPANVQNMQGALLRDQYQSFQTFKISQVFTSMSVVRMHGLYFSTVVALWLCSSKPAPTLCSAPDFGSESYRSASVCESHFCKRLHHSS
jgi:hypothetical protein